MIDIIALNQYKKIRGGSLYDGYFIFNVTGPQLGATTFDPSLALSAGAPTPTWDFTAPDGTTFQQTGAAISINLPQTGVYTVRLGPLVPSSLYRYITQMDIRTDGLTRTLPAAIGNLTKLDVLYLYTNQLTGSIPAAIGNLTDLTYLLVNSNLLTGSIPTQIGNLTKLIYLYLYGNQLTGTIPTQIGNLVNLTQLYLYSCQLSDIDAGVLGPLVKMHDLRLQSNGLTQAVGAKIVSQIYAAWGTWTDPAPLINVGGTNAALDGVYAAPPGGSWTGGPGTWVPGSSKERIYDLVNDVNVTGRIKQAWTFN